MKKSKILVSSIMVTLFSTTLLAGATYSLFTSESVHDITVGSARVDVNSIVKDNALTLYSLGVKQDTTFANGGTASFDSKTGKITLENITPGDEVEFEIMIQNNSDVKVKYRVLVEVLSNDFDNLFTFTGEGTSWTTLEAATKEKSAGKYKLALSKDAGNLLQDKTAEVRIVVEAHQFNDPALKESTITFVSNEGSVVNSITKINGYPVTKPTNPTKPGHTFVGWFKEDTLENEFVFDENTKMPKEDLTLYAKWSKNSHNLTLETNGGKLASTVSNPRAIEFDTVIGELPTPTYETYDFVGWYTDADLSVEYDPTSKMPDAPITIYAKWKEAFRKITFETGAASKVETKNLRVGSSLDTLDAPFKDSDVFLGWFKDNSYTIPFEDTKMPHEDITLYAKMVPSILNYGYDSANDCYEILNLKDNKPHDITKLELPTYHNNGTNGTKLVKTIKSINPRYLDNLTEIVFPKYLETISANAFNNDEIASTHPNKAVALNLPDTLKTIGEAAFKDFHASSVKIPTNITSIPKNAFNSCGLTSIELNENLQSIGREAFYGNEMTTIRIPSSVSSLENGVFHSCVFLNKVIFEKNSNLKVLPKYTFDACESLGDVVLPYGLTTISQHAFEYYNFSSIIIPETVVTVEPEAFIGNSLIVPTTFYIESEEQMANWNVDWRDKVTNETVVIGYENWPEDVQNRYNASK